MRLYQDCNYPVNNLVAFCGMTDSEARAVVRKVGSSKVFNWIEQLRGRGREERRQAIHERAATGGYATMGEMLVSEPFLDGVERHRRQELRRAHVCALAVSQYLRTGKADPVALNKALVLTHMSRYIRLDEIAEFPETMGLDGVKKEFRARLEAHWRKLYPHLTSDAKRPRPEIIPGAKPGYLHRQPSAGALLAATGLRPSPSEERAQ